MLNASTGAVLRTTRLGVVQYLGATGALNCPPTRQEIAVDARSNRVFVLDAGKLASASGAPYLDGPGWVYMLDATSGVLLRTVTLP